VAMRVKAGTIICSIVIAEEISTRTIIMEGDPRLVFLPWLVILFNTFLYFVFSFRSL